MKLALGILLVVLSLTACDPRIAQYQSDGDAMFLEDSSENIGSNSESYPLDEPAPVDELVLYEERAKKADKILFYFGWLLPCGILLLWGLLDLTFGFSKGPIKVKDVVQLVIFSLIPVVNWVVLIGVGIGIILDTGVAKKVDDLMEKEIRPERQP